MDFVWIAVTFFLVLCISDLHNHNKKVEEMFPDTSNQFEYRKRLDLTVSLGSLYFVLIICIIMSIHSIIMIFLK